MPGEFGATARPRRPRRSGAAAVLAVGRLEDEPLAVVAGRLPACTPNRIRSRCARRTLEIALHLRPRREVRGAVHQRPAWIERASAPRRAGCSSRSARRRACRARPARTASSRTAVAGRTASAEHAARRRVARDDGVVDAQAAEAVADLDRPRAAADDDDRIVAGRERPLAWSAAAIGVRSQRSRSAAGAPGPGASGT